MVGLGASAVYTKVDGPPLCRTCERNLRPMDEGRYFCPCCGEIAQLIERLIGNDGPDSHGWVRTGLARGTTDAHAVVMGNHRCPNAANRTPITVEQSQLDLAPKGRRR